METLESIAKRRAEKGKEAAVKYFFKDIILHNFYLSECLIDYEKRGHYNILDVSSLPTLRPLVSH